MPAVSPEFYNMPMMLKTCPKPVGKPPPLYSCLKEAKTHNSLKPGKYYYAKKLCLV